MLSTEDSTQHTAANEWMLRTHQVLECFNLQFRYALLLFYHLSSLRGCSTPGPYF